MDEKKIIFDTTYKLTYPYEFKKNKVIYYPFVYIDKKEYHEQKLPEDFSEYDLVCIRQIITDGTSEFNFHLIVKINKKTLGIIHNKSNICPGIFYKREELFPDLNSSFKIDTGSVNNLGKIGILLEFIKI